ncbi:MAG: hypothetical protein WC551_12875 [Patescibacteria group bacterium]
MSMMIDSRESLSVETVREIEAAYEAMTDSQDCDGRMDRNAVRRYYRKIRSVSELPYVTCHHVEHNPMYNPATMMVAFGRSAE